MCVCQFIIWELEYHLVVYTVQQKKKYKLVV